MIATKSLTFRKSTYSGGPQGGCIEVATTGGATRYVRDSKDKGGPVLAFATQDFAAFVENVKKNS